MAWRGTLEQSVRHRVRACDMTVTATVGVVLAGTVLAGCGVPRETVESALLAAVASQPAVATALCGHATGGLAAVSLDGLDTHGIVRADVPESTGAVYEIGTGSARVTGYDGDATPCGGQVVFTYQAAHGAGRHAQPWHVTGLGPLVVLPGHPGHPGYPGASVPPVPTSPTSLHGGTSQFDLTGEGPWDVNIFLRARTAVTVSLAPSEDREPAEDQYSFQVVLSGMPVFAQPRVCARLLRVLVAPIDGVYTLHVTSRSPVATRLLLREGQVDAYVP